MPSRERRGRPRAGAGRTRLPSSDTLREIVATADEVARALAVGPVGLEGARSFVTGVVAFAEGRAGAAAMIPATAADERMADDVGRLVSRRPEERSIAASAWEPVLSA